MSELYRQAKLSLELSNEEAINLLDDQEIRWTEDQRLISRQRKIALINSISALNRLLKTGVYLCSDRQTFTLRSAAIWEIDSIGGLVKADECELISSTISDCEDYENLMYFSLTCHREPPFILDIEWILEDIKPFRQGTEGLWLAGNSDPTLIMKLTIVREDGKEIGINYSDIEIRRDVNPDSTVTTYSTVLNNVSALPEPPTSDPAFYTPHIVWSTWESWQTLGNEIKNTFERQLKINQALRDSLHLIEERTFAMTDRAREIAQFVNRSAEYIDCFDWAWQCDVRSARKSYLSTYAHRFDRAILAAALFKEAGFMVFPFYRGKGYEDINEGVPTLARMDGISVWVSGSDQVEAFYNPETSELHNGLTPIFGRSVWFPGQGEEPVVSWQGKGTRSDVTVDLVLSFHTGNKTWSGTGYFTANQGMNPFEEMEGVDGRTQKYMQKLIAGLIPGAILTGFNPVSFNRFNVALGFQFTAEIKKDRKTKHYRFEISDLVGGVFDRLPGDVDLLREFRGTPISMAGLIGNTVKLRIDMNGLDQVILPDDVEINNPAGLLRIESASDGSETIIERELTLKSANYTPEEWHYLRDLLQADRAKSSRTIECMVK